MTRLDAERIYAGLPAQAPYTVEVFDTLASTNLTLRDLAKDGAPAGRVILAEKQTAGRGRLGREFFSPEGSGIYMSLLLRPSLAPDRAATVTTFAAVAAARAVERVSGLAVAVKWVNDLFVNGRKLCGILAEAALGTDGRISYVVLGIGINVTDAAFPEELRDIATSIEAESGRRIDRNLLVSELLSELSPLLFGCVPDGYMDEYRRRNLVTGRVVTVSSGGEAFRAYAERIEDDGNLIVRTEDGVERRIVAGDVSIRL